MASIRWTKEKLRLFKRVYANAVKEGTDPFFFMGHEFVIGYAKYLIEYLDNILE